jgi:uncharacterized metal-binding protein YceD (DUF177 family)
METLKRYEIDLKTLPQASSSRFVYDLEDDFFEIIEATDVIYGKVEVTVDVIRVASAFEMRFHTEGVVTVECDRCLAEVELPVEADNKLIVTFGKEYSETSDEHVTVSEEEGTTNIAWFMYEFIVLALPMKRVHAAGECDEEMASKLREISVEEINEASSDVSQSEGEIENIDPRWDVLRKLRIDN